MKCPYCSVDLDELSMNEGISKQEGKVSKSGAKGSEKRSQKKIATIKKSRY